MRYAAIKDFDIAQGPGVHVSLWTQGCIHMCPGCHNPETFDPDGGKEFTNKEIIKIVELLKCTDIKKGLSILGGEPLLPQNIKKLTVLLATVKKEIPDLKVWLWTGFLFEEVSNMGLFKYIDVVVDGHYDESLREVTRYKGSSNQRIIDVQSSLKKGAVVLWDIQK